MDGAAGIVAKEIQGVGYDISCQATVGGRGPTVIATRRDGQCFEVTAASDLEAMVELSRRILFDDLGRHGRNGP